MKKIIITILAGILFASNAFASNFVVETEYNQYETTGPIVWNSENNTYKFPVVKNGKKQELIISTKDSAIRCAEDNYVLQLDNYLMQVIEGWEYVLEVK